jgi:hypothetical protein
MFTTIQWVMIIFFVLYLAAVPTKEQLIEYSERKWEYRVAARIMSIFLWVAVLGWAGFWS